MNLKIYPNPTNGKFTIQITDLKSSINNQLSVTNILGETVYSSLINNKSSIIELDLSDQPSGMYIVNIRTGEKVEHKKLIKE